MVTAKRRYGFEPDYAIPPGETLRETMKSLGMNQKELAKRTNLTVQSLNRIFKGEQPITYDTASRFELVTGVPATLWNNLEAQYREKLVRIDELKRLKADLAWLKEIPVQELVKRGAIPNTQNKVSQLREALKFYAVSSVEAWRRLWLEPAVAARRSPCFESKPGPASAWIRQGELQALEIDCKPFNKSLFNEVLRNIRRLTRESARVFAPEMKRFCAESGVAVALVREMNKVPWNGATKWLTPRKAMILLCLRGKGEDKFWFSFFHEAGHVLHDSRKDLLINDGSQQDPREKRANNFAAESLIPSKYDDAIHRIRSRREIIHLADQLCIAPGIVAGRYQFLTNRWNYFKDLIRTLEWANP
jgi:addiction module HigA family antidote